MLQRQNPIFPVPISYIYNYYQQHLAKTVLLYMHFIAVARLCLISPHGLAAFLQVTLNFID